VVNAILDLIGQGNLRPTARQISERAGVSLRSVFQHFDDMESLMAAAAEQQITRVTAMSARVPQGGPLQTRIRAFVDGRSRLLEEITPMRRAALLHEPFSPEVARRLAWARKRTRDELQEVFAPELTALGEKERLEVIMALHSATEWYTWETLRSHDGLTAQTARKVMSRMVRAILKED
jgi:AcrR family transcriptional regulator